MQLHASNQATYLTFPKLKIKHCFSTRIGGVSTGITAGLNLGFARDIRSNVVKNYQIIGKEIGFDLNKMILNDQNHSDQIFVVQEKDFQSIDFPFQNVSGYDAFITNVSQGVLTTFHGDCTPVYIYDPIHQAIGLVHSGWRGTKLEITGKTLVKMKETYGTKWDEVYIWIGPRICQSCFEVDEPVYLDFKNTIPYSLPYMQSFSNKYHIDLGSIITKNLTDLGVKEVNIIKTDLCTCCRKDLFYSHRRDGYLRGSHVAMMSLP